MRGMWTSILILLVLVLALGGWVVWLQNKPAPESPGLANLDPQSIRKIIINREGEHLVFERQPSGWRMVQPFNAPADPYHIEQILSLPKQTSHARYQVPAKELPQFELAPAKVTVELDQTEFRFGMQNPIDFRRYVQVDDGAVHLIDDTLMTLLTAGATRWIDTRLLPEGARIRDLELPGWHLSLTDKGTWTSTPKADGQALAGLVNTWRNARAIEVSPFQGEVPPEAPVIHVQLDKERIDFVLLRKKPEWVLLRPDLKLTYHFYGTIGARLLQPQTKTETDSP